MNYIEHGMNCKLLAFKIKEIDFNGFFLSFLTKFRVNVCTTYNANNNTRENHETPAFFGRCFSSRLRFLLLSFDILDFGLHIRLALLPFSSSNLSIRCDATVYETNTNERQ